jgi:phosphopantetheinyl transferase
MIAALPVPDQNLGFLKLWTAKEVGLKAVGQGVASGLNSHYLSPDGYGYASEIIDEFKMNPLWSCIHLGFVPQHILAVVHSPEI